MCYYMDTNALCICCICAKSVLYWERFRKERDTMARFFMDPSKMQDNMLLLTGENFQHAKVLRLKLGEEVFVCDGNGSECVCAVKEMASDCAVLDVLTRRSSAAEPAIRACIYVAFPKSDKLEHIIQKATELGAYEIVVFPSARCVSRPDDKSVRKKLERWQKIAAAAAEQSGRGVIPRILTLGNYKEALQRAAQTDIALLFYENEHSKTLKMALTEKPFKTVSLLTGPEGGLEEAEVKQAQAAGLSVCTLGSRILRCETAPLCALSAVMYEAGEF